MNHLDQLKKFNETRERQVSSGINNEIKHQPFQGGGLFAKDAPIENKITKSEGLKLISASKHKEALCDFFMKVIEQDSDQLRKSEDNKINLLKNELITFEGTGMIGNSMIEYLNDKGFKVIR